MNAPRYYLSENLDGTYTVRLTATDAPIGVVTDATGREELGQLVRLANAAELEGAAL